MMLSRVGDALYWMSRYVERAEHAARLLEVIRRTLIDLEEVDPQTASRLWSDTLAVLGLPEGCPRDAAVLDEELAGSVSAAIFRARENARQVQEVISSEMWAYLNQTHWHLEEARRSRRRSELIPDLLTDVVKASFLWSGATDSTMARGAGWLFIRIGQFVERTDRTCHIFTTQWRAIEEQAWGQLYTTGDNFAWLTLLRSCGSLEEYRKRHPTRIDPKQIVEFLILDRSYPRTVRYSVNVAADLVRRLGAMAPQEDNSTERAFGKLSAKLTYADLPEILEQGPAAFLHGVKEDLSTATAELQHGYFLH